MKNINDIVGKFFNVLIEGRFYKAKLLKIFMAEKDRELVSTTHPEIPDYCEKYLVQLENGIKYNVTELYDEDIQ